MNPTTASSQALYQSARTLLSPDGGDSAESAEQIQGFAAIHDLVSTLAEGETAAHSLIAGTADPHSVIEAVAAAELAVETASAIRDRAVEAYQELLRMPI